MRHDLLGRLAMGSTHRTIYMPDIKGLIIPLPSRPEQARVIDDLRKELALLDETRREFHSQIALLRERRQALITHAVTHGIEGLPGVA
jgi:type I restriction enzyme S subunit